MYHHMQQTRVQKERDLPATEMVLDQMPSDSQIQQNGQLYFLVI